jgi:hypothetical protein
MKLFTIGDSISQGFMSGAAARTDQSYSTILASLLNAQNYNYPSWPKEGLPFNIETIFRRLEKRLGSNISGLFEWPVALNMINNYLDEVEDFYERGKGDINHPFSDKPYNNVAVRGFDIAYSWLINPELCRKHIELSPNKQDNWWGMVDEALLRTSLKVLEAGTSEKISNPSQLDWLAYHHKNEGVENIILWLGANNALGTVLDLNIKQTSIDGTAFAKGPEKVSFDDRKRAGWNLWHPEDFRVEYKFMLDKVISILEDNPNAVDYKVFIGTVPLVTIAPLIKAVGGPEDREQIEVEEWVVNQANPAPMGKETLKWPKSKESSYSYGKYYPYFAFADSFDISLPHLNMQQALHIDDTIRMYNKIIQELVADANKQLGTPRFYLVDISTVLTSMAIKRNNFNPTYEYPDFFKYAYPKVDTRYYGTTRNGEIKAGGIFSLDGVHPTAIGQGIIAYEFLKVMKLAGSYTGNPSIAIDWKSIFASDTLYSQPISLLSEIYDNVQLKKWLVEKIFK